jgi:hypothetical protein
MIPDTLTSQQDVGTGGQLGDVAQPVMLPEQARVAAEGSGSSRSPGLSAPSAPGFSSPVVLPAPRPPAPRPQATFDALQKWEGRVVEVLDSAFMAVVTDSSDPANEELVEFDIEEVSPGDQFLVECGSVFYWSIGYRTDPSGERSRSSVLVFRRLPARGALVTL